MCEYIEYFDTVLMTSLCKRETSFFVCLLLIIIKMVCIHFLYHEQNVFVSLCACECVDVKMFVCVSTVLCLCLSVRPHVKICVCMCV